MSSVIKCKLEIKSKAKLKQALDLLGLIYEEGENITAYGYGGKKEHVDIVVRKKSLKGSGYGAYGDLGFIWIDAEQRYDAIYDHYDHGLIETLEQTYAFQLLQELATANNYSFNILEGAAPSLKNKQTIVMEVS